MVGNQWSFFSCTYYKNPLHYSECHKKCINGDWKSCFSTGLSTQTRRLSHESIMKVHKYGRSHPSSNFMYHMTTSVRLTCHRLKGQVQEELDFSISSITIYVQVIKIQIIWKLVLAAKLFMIQQHPKTRFTIMLTFF